MAGVRFDFIILVPLLPSLCGFFFVFGCGVSFSAGFQHPPADGCSTASCDVGALAGGDELMSFFRTIVNCKPPKFVFKCGQVLRCTKD